MTRLSTIHTNLTPQTDQTPVSADEVKRLEKTFDLSKEMFAFSENLLKTLDEKSRGSVTAASAIAAFAFLVNKPAQLAQLPLASQLVIVVMALAVGTVYALNFAIVRPQRGAAIDPNQIIHLLDVTTVTEEVVYFNVQSLTGLYSANLELAGQKAVWLTRQHVALAITLLAALVYIVVPTSPVPSPTPEAGAPSQFQTVRLTSNAHTPAQVA